VDIENWRDLRVLRKTRAEAPELYQAFSVLTYITPDDSPILTIQGTADEVTPMSQAEALAGKMKEQGVPHRLEVIAGAGHSFDLQPDQADLRPMVLDFFDQHLRPRRP
jgi:dipeptidyl aminopeptidase/acylaminoacyl peptidase